MKDSKIVIGVIARPHGIRGELAVKMFSDDPAHYLDRDFFFLSVQGSLQKYSVQKSRIHKGMLLLFLDGISDRTTVEMMRGTELYIAKEELAPAGENEYFYTDLIGLDVMMVCDDQLTKQNVGSVVDVFDTGASHILVVELKGKTTAKGNPYQVNVPFIDDAVPEVELENGIVSINKAFLEME